MVLGIRSGRKVYSMKEIARRIRPVAEEFELEAVYIFGSYAKGTARPDSDVDILMSAEKVQGIRMAGSISPSGTSSGRTSAWSRRKPIRGSCPSSGRTR